MMSLTRSQPLRNLSQVIPNTFNSTSKYCMCLDPLLPTVVSFIHEFPEYLETIIHCARKTELAFWNLLFSVSHHPRQLFKMCLEEGQLDTATSCLILLQSMEPALASSQVN